MLQPHVMELKLACGASDPTRQLRGLSEQNILETECLGKHICVTACR